MKIQQLIKKNEKKKILFILSTVLFMSFLTSCGEDEYFTKKKDWTFTVTTTTTMTMEGIEVGEEESIITTVHVENLTEAEAKAEAEKMEKKATITTTEFGVTMKVVATVTYKEKTVEE